MPEAAPYGINQMEAGADEWVRVTVDDATQCRLDDGDTGLCHLRRSFQFMVFQVCRRHVHGDRSPERLPHVTLVAGRATLD